jgi:hypothetical protein
VQGSAKLGKFIKPDNPLNGDIFQQALNKFQTGKTISLCFIV